MEQPPDMNREHNQDQTSHDVVQVVFTIHQPSSDICEMFDDFMLMADGRVLYCGEWGMAEDHFSDLALECVPLLLAFCLTLIPLFLLLFLSISLALYTSHVRAGEWVI